VNPTVVDYSTDLEHDGRSYHVALPDLRVFRCEACGVLVLPDESHRRLSLALRTEAGLLTPAEIKRNRDKLGLTQKQLADLIQVAECTVCRWETGAQIQQRAMDQLLRLFFEVPAVRDYLEQNCQATTDLVPLRIFNPGDRDYARVPDTREAIAAEG
jgi:putative zinc finger/helix-turn-helix YgiT family protein